MMKLALTTVLLFMPMTTVAWAPSQTPPTSLSKVLEFAEKAWAFPNAKKDVPANGVPHRLSDETQHRMLPWTHQQATAVSSNSLRKVAFHRDTADDPFYFDGCSGPSTEWPTRQAFLESLHPKRKSPTARQLTRFPQEPKEILEYYFDDMGAPMSWSAVSSLAPNNHKCEHSYWDPTSGQSVCWGSSAVHHSLIQQPRNKALKMLPEEHELLEYYYDDMGAPMSWSASLTTPISDHPKRQRKNSQNTYWTSTSGQSVRWGAAVVNQKANKKVDINQFIKSCDESDGNSWYGQ